MNINIKSGFSCVECAFIFILVRSKGVLVSISVRPLWLCVIIGVVCSIRLTFDTVGQLALSRCGGFIFSS